MIDNHVSHAFRQQNTSCFIKTFNWIIDFHFPVKKVPHVLPPFAIEDKGKTDLNLWGRDRSSFWLQRVGGGEPREACFIQKSPNFLRAQHNTKHWVYWLATAILSTTLTTPNRKMECSVRISFVSTCLSYVCHLSNSVFFRFGLQRCHTIHFFAS